MELNAGSFVFLYVLFFATGMAYAMIARKMGAWSYKAGVGVALVTGFALGWGTMVQVADSGHPERLWYDSVLVVGAIGACLWLKAPGLAWTLFAMAATLALIAVILPWARRPTLRGEWPSTWCLRGVIHRLRSAVPACGSGGIEIRPRAITYR